MFNDCKQVLLFVWSCLEIYNTVMYSCSTLARKRVHCTCQAFSVLENSPNFGFILKLGHLENIMVPLWFQSLWWLVEIGLPCWFTNLFTFYSFWTRCLFYVIFSNSIAGTYYTNWPWSCVCYCVRRSRKASTRYLSWFSSKS